MTAHEGKQVDGKGGILMPKLLSEQSGDSVLVGVLVHKKKKKMKFKYVV